MHFARFGLKWAHMCVELKHMFEIFLHQLSTKVCVTRELETLKCDETKLTCRAGLDSRNKPCHPLSSALSTPTPTRASFQFLDSFFSNSINHSLTQLSSSQQGVLSCFFHRSIFKGTGIGSIALLKTDTQCVCAALWTGKHGLTADFTSDNDPEDNCAEIAFRRDFWS